MAHSRVPTPRVFSAETSISGTADIYCSFFFMTNNIQFMAHYCKSVTANLGGVLMSSATVLAMSSESDSPPIKYRHLAILTVVAIVGVIMSNWISDDTIRVVLSVAMYCMPLLAAPLHRNLIWIPISALIVTLPQFKKIVCNLLRLISEPGTLPNNSITSILR